MKSLSITESTGKIHTCRISVTLQVRRFLKPLCISRKPLFQKEKDLIATGCLSQAREDQKYYKIADLHR